jgi:hypothetical protein
LGSPLKDMNLSSIYDFNRVKVLRCEGQVAHTIRIKKQIRNLILKNKTIADLRNQHVDECM